ncbi:MAG: hypothetical protein ACOZNI_23975 [Myxococcota bacterium]
MKPFLPAVAALVVGILLGAWQPRGELLALRAEADTLRAKAERPCRGRAAESIRTILRAEPPDAPEPDDGEAPAAPATPPPAEDGARIEIGGEALPVEDAEEVKDQMAAALDARRAQALAALAEQADLDEAEIAGIDAVMDDMNRQLEVEVDRFVEEAVARGDVDRRDIMDFAAESLDIVIATDDRLREALGDEVYAEVDDSALDPLSYLSGDTLDSLTRLQDVPGLDD